MQKNQEKIAENLRIIVDQPWAAVKKSIIRELSRSTKTAEELAVYCLLCAGHNEYTIPSYTELDLESTIRIKEELEKKYGEV